MDRNGMGSDVRNKASAKRQREAFVRTDSREVSKAESRRHLDRQKHQVQN